MSRLSLVPVAVLSCALAACELTEVTIVDFAEVFVVEAYVTVAEDPAANSLRIFMHGTAPGFGPASRSRGVPPLVGVGGRGSGFGAASLSVSSLPGCLLFASAFAVFGVGLLPLPFGAPVWPPSPVTRPPSPPDWPASTSTRPPPSVPPSFGGPASAVGIQVPVEVAVPPLHTKPGWQRSKLNGRRLTSSHLSPCPPQHTE